MEKMRNVTIQIKVAGEYKTAYGCVYSTDGVYRNNLKFQFMLS